MEVQATSEVPSDTQTAESGQQEAPEVEETMPTVEAEVAPESASDPFTVFDGPVRDVTKKRSQRAVDPGETTDAEVVDATEAPKGRRKRKGKAEKVEVDPEAKLNEARGLVKTAELFHMMVTRKRLAVAGYVGAELESAVAEHAFSDQEVDSLAEPLAEGLAKEGVELPWEVRALLAGVVVMLPRMAMASEQEKLGKLRVVVGERVE